VPGVSKDISSFARVSPFRVNVSRVSPLAVSLLRRSSPLSPRRRRGCCAQDRQLLPSLIAWTIDRGDALRVPSHAYIFVHLPLALSVRSFSRSSLFAREDDFVSQVIISLEDIN